MPTKKIADLPPPHKGWESEPTKYCQDPCHDPPSMRVFEPGLYEHTCPRCGHKTPLTVHERAIW